MSRRGWLWLAALALSGAAGGCTPEPSRVDPPVAPTAAPPGASGSPASETTSAPSARRPRLVALGDSLTAGLGLSPEQSWPALLQGRLDAAGHDLEVVNAGVSGDTSAGGLRRLDWALDGDIRILIIELGANDGLRGLPVAQMHDNLERIITSAKARGITVLLCGMEAPPNLGSQYTRAFRDAFRDLADEHDVAFLPFLLQGVAGDDALNQADGIHPNVTGARRVADLVWQSLEPLLPRALASS